MLWHAFIAVLLCDNAAAMQLLMQYPWTNGDIASTMDINDMIQLALHFRKPEVSNTIPLF